MCLMLSTPIKSFTLNSFLTRWEDLRPTWIFLTVTTLKARLSLATAVVFHMLSVSVKNYTNKDIGGSYNTRNLAGTDIL